MTDPGLNPETISPLAEFRPIAAYGLLADCNAAALVDRDGSVSWLCLLRFHSTAVFARILHPAGGHWSIAPTRAYRSARRYLPGTLVIETTFATGTGRVKLIDAMAFAEGQRGHELGFVAPHLLLRSVEGLEGEVELRLELVRLSLTTQSGSEHLSVSATWCAVCGMPPLSAIATVGCRNSRGTRKERGDESYRAIPLRSSCQAGRGHHGTKDAVHTGRGRDQRG